MDARRPVDLWTDRLQRLLAPLTGRQYDPDTLRSVPSWGLSFLLHALMLLVLALLIRVGRPSPATRAIESRLPGEINDLTSLVEAPRRVTRSSSSRAWTRPPSDWRPTTRR